MAAQASSCSTAPDQARPRASRPDGLSEAGSRACGEPKLRAAPPALSATARTLRACRPCPHTTSLPSCADNSRGCPRKNFTSSSITARVTTSRTSVSPWSLRRSWPGTWGRWSRTVEGREGGTSATGNAATRRWPAQDRRLCHQPLRPPHRPRSRTAEPCRGSVAHGRRGAVRVPARFASTSRPSKLSSGPQEAQNPTCRGPLLRTSPALRLVPTIAVRPRRCPCRTTPASCPDALRRGERTATLESARFSSAVRRLGKPGAATRRSSGLRPRLDLHAFARPLR